MNLESQSRYLEKERSRGTENSIEKREEKK
jgi:hypothetical protein